MWEPSGCDVCHPIDCQSWFCRPGWLGRCPLPPSPLQVCPSTPSCTLGGRGWPSPIEEDHSSMKGICAAVLSCKNLQTSPQRPFVGKCRIVKLPRLQTLPNEALHVAVCLKKKKMLNRNISLWETNGLCSLLKKSCTLGHVKNIISL